jgi:hypothetical protein
MDGKDAETFLKRIRDFSIVKRDQIDTAIQFRDTFKENPRKRKLDPAVKTQRDLLTIKLKAIKEDCPPCPHCNSYLVSVDEFDTSNCHNCGELYMVLTP